MRPDIKKLEHFVNLKDNLGPIADQFYTMMTYVKHLEKTVDDLLKTKELHSSPIIDVSGEIIDLRHVQRVGNLESDYDFLKYPVYFASGDKITIYHNSDRYRGHNVLHMNRDKFIELLKSYKS